MRKNFARPAMFAVVLMLILSACGGAPAANQAPAAAPATDAPETQVPAGPFVFGMLLVGAKNDQGWNQAHYEAGQYVEKNLPKSKMIYFENVYSGSPSYPGQTASQLAEKLVSQGAKLIVFNSSDMKDEVLKFAKAHPDIYVIGAAVDWTWKEGQNHQESRNQVDIMGRMEYGEMMAGCAAALTSQSGMIGYLGSLINNETRRFASSAYLGAKYCWSNILMNDPAKLSFKVTWSKIPGATSDPTQVADEFFNSGYDVVISGIDTTEALVEAKKMKDAGKTAYAIPYNFKDACKSSPEVCLGVPYFNWGPAYLKTMKAAADGSLQESFLLNGPDWKNINNPDTSAVGFVKGPALSADASTKLDGFIAELAHGRNMWLGPMNLQDKTVFLKEAEGAVDQQIWYVPQLLEGMEGQSVSK